MDRSGADAVISSATRGKLLVVAVFLLGSVVGAVLDNLYETRWNAADPNSRSQREVNQVYDLLDLSPEQRQEWKTIVDASRPAFEKLFAENQELLKPNRKKYAELQEETRTKIRAILTDEQVKLYNELNERRQRRGQRGQPGPPRADKE